jgi:SAM-dependent methyltransferase
MINAKKMAVWWQSALGQYVLEREKRVIKKLKPYLNGYFQAQVYGTELILPLMDKPCCQFHIAEGADITAFAEYLPLQSNSIDVLVLPHVLEYSVDPHQVLREAERVVCDGGTLVLCCFRPLSFWGIWRLLTVKKQMPWHGRFFSRSRLKDWLGLLRFEIEQVEHVVFIPPFSSANNIERWSFFEALGKRCWPKCAAVSVIVAKKRVLPMTMISHKKRKLSLFPAAGLVKPMTGYNKN